LLDLHSLAAWRGEPIKRRDHGEETLAEIGPQLQRVRLDDCAA
jgi:hypothetical protein